MVETKEQSFGAQVFWRAWFAAWSFFESKLRDAVLFVALFTVGGIAYLKLFGFPATREQVVPVLIFTVGPIVALWVLLFIWHLWLAPSALAYEAARAVAKTTPQLQLQQPIPSPRSEKAINWTIWKARQTYNLMELSGILAKVEPANEILTPERAAFLRLIAEATRTKKLAAFRQPNGDLSLVPDISPTWFHASKAKAIEWANSEGFDVSHIQ